MSTGPERPTIGDIVADEEPEGTVAAKTLGVGFWLAIGWLVLIVLLAVLLLVLVLRVVVVVVLLAVLLLSLLLRVRADVVFWRCRCWCWCCVSVLLPYRSQCS